MQSLCSLMKSPPHFRLKIPHTRFSFNKHGRPPRYKLKYTLKYRINNKEDSTHVTIRVMHYKYVIDFLLQSLSAQKCLWMETISVPTGQLPSLRKICKQMASTFNDRVQLANGKTHSILYITYTHWIWSNNAKRYINTYFLRFQSENSFP